MSSDVRLVSDLKRENVCGTAEEGEIVIKEEMEDEASFIDLLMKPIDHRDDGGPYLAGDLVQVNIKEAEVTHTTSDPPPTSRKRTRAELRRHQHEEGHKWVFQQAPFRPEPGTSADQPEKQLYSCTVAYCCETFKHPSHLAKHSRGHQFDDFPVMNANSSKEAETTKKSNKSLESQVEPTSQLNLNTAPLQSSTQTAKKGRYQCTVCSASFSDSATTLEHIRAHSTNNYRRPTCPDCERAFDSKAKLSSHRLAPCPGKPPPRSELICQFCGKKFLRKYDFTVHFRQHTGERPYLCHLCPATFTGSSNLRQHLKRTHKEGEKGVEPQGVQEAPKKAKKRSISHPCSLCPRTFNRPYKLNAHRAVHRLKIAWKCELCGALYASDFNRRKHQEVAHQDGEESEPEEDESPSHVIKEKPTSYTCPFCPFLTYTNARTLKRHTLRMHPVPGTEHQSRTHSGELQMEMEEIAVFQELPEVKQEFEDEEEEEIVFCKTIK